MTTFNDMIVYVALTGSRGYGLHNENSDFDWRGFYVPPTSYVLGLKSYPEQIEVAGQDATYWELGKYVNLLLQANPNVLETLWADSYSVQSNILSPFINELRQNRKLFLSVLLIKTYGGYATSEWHRGEAYIKSGKEDKVKQGWKHMMHLIRLLLSANYALSHNDLIVNMSKHRDLLLSIRNAEMSFDALTQKRDELEKEFNQLKEKHNLPETPDKEWAHDWLVRVRQVVYEAELRNEWLIK